MKQECPIYLKSISNSKALATTLSDTKPEANSDDSDLEEIVNAFTDTIEFPKEAVELIDEEEEVMESKFEKNDEQDDIHIAYSKLYKVSKKHEKLYRLATRKLSEVELEWEELSTKVDKANQTTRALRSENNFLAWFLICFWNHAFLHCIVFAFIFLYSFLLFLLLLSRKEKKNEK